VALVRQRRPLDDPALTSPDDVWDAVERLQVAGLCRGATRVPQGTPSAPSNGGAWGARG
jgi:hypothetical protein